MLQIELCPPNLYVEALIPKVVLFGSKAFGRLLGLDEGMPHERISTLIRREVSELPFSPAIEDSARSQ